MSFFRRSQAAPVANAPPLPGGFSRDIVMLSEPAGPRAEAIRALRTQVMAQHLSMGRRALAVVAPSVDCGCSFVTANLAVAFSQIGVKTLLLDGDLRTAGIDFLIGPRRPGVGLRACLSEDVVNIASNIEESVQPNLSVMHAGEPATDPSELLGDVAFEQLMAACMREYDLTLIDSPPANIASDALRLSVVAGYSLIVTRRNRSLVPDVKTLAADLAANGAKVIGTVLVER